MRAEGLAASRDEFQGMITDCLEREAVGTRYEGLVKSIGPPQIMPTLGLAIQS